MSEDSFFDTYIAESRSHIGIMEKKLLDLESSTDRKALLQEIFRAAHTIKGSSAIIRYLSIKDVAHAMESLLQTMLDDVSIFSHKIIDTLLSACDFLNAALDKLPDTNYGMDEKDAICENLYRLAPLLPRPDSEKPYEPSHQDTQEENLPESPKATQIFFLMFESRGTFFTTPLYYVKEVLRRISIKPINIVEEHIMGIANYHGDILPIIDFGRRFGLFHASYNNEERIVVFKLREALLGVKVDALIKIFSPDHLMCCQETDNTLRLFCDGYYEMDDTQVHIINIDTLFYRERT